MIKTTTVRNLLLITLLSLCGLFQFAAASSPTVSIAAIASDTTPQINETVTVEFRMNTDNHSVTVVGVSANYSNNLEFVSYDASGSNLSTGITNPSPNTQTRTFRFERADFGGVNSANALLMKINFKAISAGPATITIDNESTEVYDNDMNLFNQQSMPTIVTVAAAATPTPTPQPTSSATATPGSGGIGGNNNEVQTSPSPTQPSTAPSASTSATPTPAAGTSATPTPQATQSSSTTNNNATSTPTPSSTSSSVATTTTSTPKPSLIQSIFKPKSTTTPTPRPTTKPTVLPTITADGQPTALPTFIFTYEPVAAEETSSGSGRAMALGIGILFITLALIGVWYAYRKHEN